eukprot:TRINITY_DN7323_c0_g1_i1.p1 TRINITY_DN7323_c0_g1~~TRINITY_DN7323_c0_g1_i1.p1  ORF type:complete len:633 (-),score=115.95 TRINITY_DN7323_c0_g1_i1:8-1906(-)
MARPRAVKMVESSHRIIIAMMVMVLVAGTSVAHTMREPREFSTLVSTVEPVASREVSSGSSGVSSFSIHVRDGGVGSAERHVVDTAQARSKRTSHPPLVVNRLKELGLFGAGAVNWYNCSTYTQVPGYWPPSFLPPVNATATCAHMTMPLDWTSSINDDTKNANATITLFVKKVAATQQPSKRQVWFLQGGPGGTGVAMEAFIPSMIATMPQYDIMIPDHRGTGQSSPFECPQINNLTTVQNFLDCIAYLNKTLGNDQHQFTTTNAAFDISGAITNSIESGQDAFIYGVSYGSYWAQRYLVVAPGQATASTIDGVCPPDLCRLADSADQNQNTVGANILTLCASESKVCNVLLGEFPADQLTVLFQELRAGVQQCLNGLGAPLNDNVYLRNVLAGFEDSESNRLLIGPVLKRMLFCSESDQVELKRFVGWVSNQTGYGANSTWKTNILLAANIGLSELFTLQQPAPDATYFSNLDQSLSFSADTGIQDSQTLPLWNVYDPTTTLGYNEYPNVTDTPIYMVTGELDPQTIDAWITHASRIYGAQTNGDNPEYFAWTLFPYAPHGAALFSPTSNDPQPGDVACAFTALAGWFTEGKPDLTCMKSLVAPDWDGLLNSTQTLSSHVFGTQSLWGSQ